MGATLKNVGYPVFVGHVRRAPGKTGLHAGAASLAVDLQSSDVDRAVMGFERFVVRVKGVSQVHTTEVGPDDQETARAFKGYQASFEVGAALLKGDIDASDLFAGIIEFHYLPGHCHWGFPFRLYAELEFFRGNVEVNAHVD